MGIVTSDTFSGAYFLDISLACFQFFLSILKLHKKYLKSCERKEYARRKLNCISIYLSKAKVFIKSFSESGFKFLKSL